MKVKGKTKTLDEVCSFIRGVTFGKHEEIETTDGFGILRSHNVDFENFRVSFHDMKYISPKAKVKDEQRLLKNDILISVANSKEQTGKVGFSFTDTDFFAGGFMAIMRPLNGINPYYLFANLSTHNFKQFIEGKNQGTTSIWNITFNRIKDYEFIVPDKEKQTQIAELFQSIETAIEQAEQQEKNLLDLKKTLSNSLVSKEPVFGNLLNKKNCTLTNFNGVADCIEQHDKQKKDVSRFIGLENIEPENLKISTWGNIKDGTTFTKRFSKGDVLFGKRRAYLKKVAVADFDGICSGDILVLRAKEKKMLSELLPFYVSAEAFINHAVSTSAGSLSPRTKWRDLSSLEVSIPDLKTQEKILEIFQQIETTLSQLKTQKQTLKNLKQKLLNEILG
ncbi:MAG: hypothetical protein A2073_03570 [Deltaproteobacteria bacterium GWC2_42_11]|nr:MAG: hypothetical protein A2073_03570 [Deltaproteobacteria bacterium GWC2_42_11]HBO84975.1 hypothetical protein [Deltaproteobacteria bacterium]